MCRKHQPSQIVSRLSPCQKCGKDIKIRATGGRIPKLCATCKATKPKKKYYIPAQPKEARQVLCVFGCGCKLPKGESVYKKVNGNGKRACPKHRKILTHRETVCYKCGKVFEVDAPGPCPDNCPVCIAKAKRKPKKVVKRAAVEGSVSKSDCINRMACLDRHDEDDCLPCLSCTRYTQEVVDIGLVASRTYDPYEWARGEI